MFEYKELYTIDFREVDTFWEFHYVIKEALDFPSYYGCNFDALWDFLTDMVDIDEPLNIEILGLNVIRKKFGDDFTQRFINVLVRLKHCYNDKYFDVVHIEIVDGDKREELM